MTTTPNSADLETAAKAICKSEGFDWDVQDNMTTPNGEEPEQMREHYRSTAKAALSALSSRQPELVETQDYAKQQADHWLPDMETKSLDARHASLKAMAENCIRYGMSRATDQTAPDAGLVEVMNRLHDNLAAAPHDAKECWVSLDDQRAILAKHKEQKP